MPMHLIFTILARSTMNSQAVHRHDGQLAVDVLERSTIFGGQVVPDPAVAAIDRVLNLVDVEVANVVGDLHLKRVRVGEVVSAREGLREVPQPSKQVERSEM